MCMFFAHGKKMAKRAKLLFLRRDRLWGFAENPFFLQNVRKNDHDFMQSLHIFSHKIIIISEKIWLLWYNTLFMNGEGGKKNQNKVEEFKKNKTIAICDAEFK